MMGELVPLSGVRSFVLWLVVVGVWIGLTGVGS